METEIAAVERTGSPGEPAPGFLEDKPSGSTRDLLVGNFAVKHGASHTCTCACAMNTGILQKWPYQELLHVSLPPKARPKKEKLFKDDFVLEFFCLPIYITSILLGCKKLTSPVLSDKKTVLKGDFI